MVPNFGRRIGLEQLVLTTSIPKPNSPLHYHRSREEENSLDLHTERFTTLEGEGKGRQQFRNLFEVL
jgi:hypothetical protein